MPSFEEIAEANSWDAEKRLEVLRAYTINQQDEDALSDFAATYAEVERGT